MKLQILFNSKAVQKDLSTGWGFSCLVDGRLLFDTGESPRYLANNLDLLKVDTDPVEAVVLSHDHWDHTGGLEEVLRRRPGLDIYICPNFSEKLKCDIPAFGGRAKESGGFQKIFEGISVTGEITGRYHGKDIAEQALVLETAKGLTIVTGCAHPGILKIIAQVKEKFPRRPIYAVLGGFHLRDFERYQMCWRTDRSVKTIKGGD